MSRAPQLWGAPHLSPTRQLVYDNDRTVQLRCALALSAAFLRYADSILRLKRIAFSSDSNGVCYFRFVMNRREAVHFSQAFLEHDNPGDHAICVLGFVLSRRDRAKSWEVRRLSPQPSFSLPALPAAAGGTHGPGRSTRTIPPSPAEDDLSDAF